MGKKRRRKCLKCQHAWIKKPKTTPHGCYLPIKKRFEGKNLDLVCVDYQERLHYRNAQVTDGMTFIQIAALLTAEGLNCVPNAVRYIVDRRGFKTIQEIREHFFTKKAERPKNLKMYDITMPDGSTARMTVDDIVAAHQDSNNISSDMIRNRLYNDVDVWKPKRRPRPEKPVVVKRQMVKAKAKPPPKVFNRALACYKRNEKKAIISRCKHYWELTETFFFATDSRPNRCKNALESCNNFCGELLKPAKCDMAVVNKNEQLMPKHYPQMPGGGGGRECVATV